MLPKQAHRKATSLMDYLKGKRHQIGYDGQMQLVLDGRPVPGTNYVDLMQTLYSHSSKTHPAGLEPFLKSLNRLNVPHSLITNKNLLSRMSHPYRTRSSKSLATSSQSGQGQSKPSGKPIKLLRLYR